MGPQQSSLNALVLVVSRNNSKAPWKVTRGEICSFFNTLDIVRAGEQLSVERMFRSSVVRIPSYREQRTQSVLLMREDVESFLVIL